MSTRSGSIPVACLLLGLTAGVAFADATNLGEPINGAEIAAWDISILPDGTGLPPGAGTPAQGVAI